MTTFSTPVSPCIGVCAIDDDTGFCRGCARTLDEIAAWGGFGKADRDAVWSLLPGRFRTMGIASRRLPLDQPALRKFVTDSIDNDRGVWVLGVMGAVGEFTRDGENLIASRWDGDTLTAISGRARLRLKVDHRARLYEVHRPGDAERPSPVVLVTDRHRGGVPVADVISDLGHDQGAIDADHRGHRLFDYGIGRAAARFCVRTDDAEVIAALEAHVGRTAADAMPAVGPLLVAKSPARVIETALGRVEIGVPIPPPHGAAPTGPHTHFLPDLLARGEDAPVDFGLPDHVMPGALFYPTDG